MPLFFVLAYYAVWITAIVHVRSNGDKSKDMA